MTSLTETAVDRAAAAIADALDLDADDAYRAASAALEAAQPSPAMAVRAARLLLTKAGVLPEVHTAFGEPLRPLCGNPEGFGPGGHATLTLEITCQGCMDRHGFTEDQLAEFDRWAREGIPADQFAMSSAEARAIVEAGI